MDENKPPAKDSQKGALDIEKDNDSGFSYFFSEDDNPDSLSSLVDALRSVNLKSKESEQNAYSISDNNGGRIELDEGEDVVKK